MSESEATPQRPQKFRPWLRLLLMFLIFVSGGIVGVGGTLIFIRSQVQQRIHHPEKAPRQVAARMKWVLGLDEEQTAQVEQIIRQRQQAIQSIRREFQPKFDEELDLLGEEISEVLNADQEAEWREWYRELRERWIPPVPPATDGEASGEK